MSEGSSPLSMTNLRKQVYLYTTFAGANGPIGRLCMNPSAKETRRSAIFFMARGESSDCSCRRPSQDKDMGEYGE